MTPSIREQILRAMTGVLTPVAALQGARLLRSPVVGVTREESPALLLFPESDTISLRSNDRVERQLVVRLVALARESGGEAPKVHENPDLHPDDDADAALERLHGTARGAGGDSRACCTSGNRTAPLLRLGGGAAMKLRIALLKPHVHQGAHHQAGDVLKLDADLARWLIRESASRALKEADFVRSDPKTHSSTLNTNRKEKSP
jgi:hypothetical protein